MPATIDDPLILIEIAEALQGDRLRQGGHDLDPEPRPD